MNLNDKLFDVLPEQMVSKVKTLTDVRNTRLKDLTLDELRELFPILHHSMKPHEFVNRAEPELVQSLKLLIKIQQ